MTVFGAVGWVARWIVFAVQFAWEMLVAAIDVARDVVLPNSRFSPGILEFRLRCRTEFEITMMANCITLTPGTLTLATRHDPPTVWVHAMYCADRDTALADLRAYEGKMLRAVRSDGRVEPAPEDPSAAEADDTGGGR